MPLATYMGAPLGVPYANLRIADPEARKLDYLTLSVAATASDVVVRTASHSGPIRWHIMLAANETMHFSFAYPIPVEQGLYIQASKACVIWYGVRY